MDNLTHSLIGLAAAKAGLDKLSPATTSLCLLAANAPDADIIALLGGRWLYLQHHRGITHSIGGTVFFAIALPLLFYFGDRLLARFRKREPRIRLPGLLLASFLVSASHPLMDWTNNYGMRFLLPWSQRWFYGDLVFIIDPFLWMILGGATFLLMSNTKLQRGVWLLLAVATSFLVMFGTASRGGLSNALPLRIAWIAALVVLMVLFWQQKGERWGARIPIAALSIAGVYLAGLFIAHAIALRQTRAEATNIGSANGERIIQVAATPTLANPFRWVSLVETDRATYRFGLGLLDDSKKRSDLVRFEKPQGRAEVAVDEAARDGRAQVFLNFARFPVVNVAEANCTVQTLVQFADLRYTEPGRGRGMFSLEVPVDCPVEKSSE